ncbi:uncharacterized protein LOC135154245 [Lytechinus pictus]|uniref:uncharacterized protein LOC135154245 n=1 Tax=Lytechinus pictus TaxID=7653 RepID=UPI0030B9E100
MDDLKPFHPGGGDVILGSGVSATVQLFRHEVTNEPIAVKIFKLPDDIQEMNEKMGHIAEEAGLLDIIGRNNCFPSYLGCLETSLGYVGLAMGFVGDPATGESWTLARGMRELVLSTKEWYQLALDITISLGQMHGMGYLMNDLKEDNCLLRKTRTGRWEAVIVDFGLVFPQASPFFCYLSQQEKEKYRRKEIYTHIAPECALDDQGTTIMSDVFQLGRVLKLMGVAAAYNDELNFIGTVCTQKSPLKRMTIREIIEYLECLM